MASRYWVGSGSSENWNATGSTNWSATSGGANNASVPGSSDDVFFDASSGTGNSKISGAITIKSIDCTGYTGTLTHGSGIDWTISGSGVVFKFSSGMTYTLETPVLNSDIFFTGTSGTTLITTAGKSMPEFHINGNGTFQLQDDLTVNSTTLGIQLSRGTFDANNKNVTAIGFSSPGTTTRTLTMGSGTWTMTGTGVNTWNVATSASLTLNANTSTIIINNTTSTSKTFAGGNRTYNVVTITGDNITITGSNTFATLNVNNAGLTNGLKITSGTTQIVTTFSSNGSVGNLAKILSVTAGSAHTLSKASGTVNEDYMSIKDSTATGGATWYAGANSTNVSGNSGWIFSAGTSISHYLKVTNFGFDLPADATVLGIEIAVEVKQSGDLGGKDSTVRIVKGGTIGSTDRSSPTEYPTTEAYRTYGSSTDLWGETWTVANIEASTFGFALSFQVPAGNVTTVSLDHIRVTVHYSTSSVVAIAAIWDLFQWG